MGYDIPENHHGAGPPNRTTPRKGMMPDRWGRGDARGVPDPSSPHARRDKTEEHDMRPREEPLVVGKIELGAEKPFIDPAMLPKISDEVVCRLPGEDEEPFGRDVGEEIVSEELMKPRAPEVKETNPKDAVGVRKWRQFTTVPFTVLWELGVAMLEGARKYGRHNYRVAPVRGSIYIDAAKGHLDCWWEGEDLDPDTGLSHITKAIASLVVLRDAQLQGMAVDDRPPKCKNLDQVKANLQSIVDEMFERIPEPKPAFLEGDQRDNS